MPSLLTHYYFAEDFLFRHHGENSFLTGYEEAFRLGSQGPDPLFFIGLLPNRHFDPLLAKERIGSKIHHTNFRGLFNIMCKELDVINLDNEKYLFESFILGQIAHYLLDSTCHPYVYYWSGFDSKGKLTGKYHYAHAHFEAKIDSCLSKNRSEKELVLKPYKIYQMESDSLSSISVDFTSSLNVFFNKNLKSEAYANAVNNTYSIYKYVHSGSSLRSKVLGKSALGQLYIPHSSEDSCLNNSHLEWKEPGSGTKRKEAFDELYNKALRNLDDIYKSIYTNGFYLDSLVSFTKDINYNGLKEGQINKYKDKEGLLTKKSCSK